MKITKTLITALAICAAGLATAQEAPSAGHGIKKLTTVHETKISDGVRLICRQANIEELLAVNDWKMEPCNDWTDDVGQITLNGRHKMVIDTTSRIDGRPVTIIRWSVKRQR